MKDLYMNPFGPLNNSSTEWFLLSFGGLCCASSIFCLGYMYKKLKLNASIKSILYIIGCHHFICSILVIIGTIINMINQESTIESCVLIIFPSCLTVDCDLVSIPLISLIRYYMVLKTSKTQILDPESIKRFCIVFYIAFYGSYLGLYIIGEMKKGISPIRLCLNDGYLIDGKIPAAQFIVFFFVLSCSCIGFAHDTLLYFLTKNMNTENKINPVIKKGDNLIPWKSTSKNGDSGVPLRSTIISSITTFVFFSVFSYRFSLTNEHIDFIGWYTVTAFMFVGTFRLPLILIFTIKHKKKVVISQPPQNLQLHEEESEPVR